MFLGCPHDPGSKGVQKECPCKRMPMFFNVHTAAAYGDLEGVRSNILKKTDRMDSIDQYGYSPIHLAAQGNYVEIVNLLIEFGAKVDGLFEVSKCTPLHRATSAGAQECCLILLEHGANIEEKDYSFGDHKTPFLKACSIGNIDIVKLLITYGANIHVIDSKGEGALELASAYPELREYLKTLGLKPNEESSVNGVMSSRLESLKTPSSSSTSTKSVPATNKDTSLVNATSDAVPKSTSFGITCPSCQNTMIVANRTACCKKLLCKSCRKISQRNGCILCC